jgi:superfamily I DNA/RNA helicase
MSNKYLWSSYQKDIFREVKEGEGHVVIDALAGSGKTSTIIESLEYIPEGKSWLLVAFNKRIAEELKKKAPMGGDIRTLHSLGLRALYKKFPKLHIANDKVDRIMSKVVGKDKQFWDVKQQIKKTVSLAKAYLVEGSEFIDFIMDNHDIDTFEMKREIFIEKVQDVLRECALNTKEIDFDDMIWIPHVHRVFVQKYHYVFVDEAQDLNNAQINLSLKACKRNGRIIALGDKNQAIYGFRGASSDAISQIKSHLTAKSLPLSITYRCPVRVTKEAQKYVPEIEYAPGAKQGIVDHIESDQMLRAAEPGCFILSRTNAPLVSYALQFISRGIPASIQGKDIGENLLNLIKKSRRKNLENFLDWLCDWEQKEINRLREKNRDFDHVRDKAACLRAIAGSSGSLAELKTKIIDLFEDTDENDRIILSTVHKAKGLERDVVFVLWGTFRGGNREERNIRYVAISRSARELYYVT